MFLSCGFPSVVAGGRRTLVFADFGGAINSDDFELFTDGIITLSGLTAITRQDFELFTDGFVRLGSIFDSRLAQDFETSIDGTTSNIGLYSFATGASVTNVSSGYFRPSVKSEKNFETFSDGVILDFSSLDALYPDDAGYSHIYL